MASRSVLITGFAPYGGRGLNPAHQVATALDGQTIAALEVVGRVLPVSYKELRDRIRAALDEVDPAIVIGLGLWPGEPMIRLERLAANLADFEIPDNAGAYIRETPIVESGPAALLATLPLGRIEAALLDAGIPARISNTAGSFLCNATLYSTLSLAGDEDRLCGFIHLPYLPAQVSELLRQQRSERQLELHQRADLASMDLGTMVEAVRIAVSVSADSAASA